VKQTLIVAAKDVSNERERERERERELLQTHLMIIFFKVARLFK